MWAQFDQGTQRAILRLHRSTTTPLLVSTTAALDHVTQPTLIVWGERDPWRALPTPRNSPPGCRTRISRRSKPPATGHGGTIPAAARAIEDFLR